jgi:flavin-dependent dehydrogenase
VTDRPSEVLVVGGGPAGATAAKLLADWGHAVRLVTRAPGEARLAESLPPSCAKLFEAIGISAAIERAGFIRSTGNTVWWGTDTPRVELFADGARGWQIEAELLAAVLLDEAAGAGVTVERRTLTADGIGPPSPGELEVGFGATRTADEKRPIVLDCSGRSGVLARAHGLRHYEKGPRTIALVASWYRERDWNIPDPSHTVVESYEGGWAWSVPTSARHRHLAVMVDPERSGLARGGSARDIYLAEVDKTRVFRSLVHAAMLDAGPWGWDASMYHAQAYAGDRWLLVGDAGSFIDPLSSAGVKKALASGWLAAVVANTILVRPALREHALRFFEDREREIYQRFRSMTRRMLAEAAVGHEHRFWADRWDESQGPEPGADPLDDEVSIHEALERLRNATTFGARRGGGVVIAPRPTVKGREIVLEDRLVSAATPSGIRYVRGVDLLMLIELAPRFSDVPDLFHAYCHESGAVPLPDFLAALATALARGWLVAE